MKRSGIYQIKNIVNGKVYYGQAVGFKHRWDIHRSDLKNQNHHAKHLERSWHKYGSDKFTFEIVEECEPITEILNAREQYWLDTVRVKNADGTLGEIDHNLAFNSSPTAGSTLGYKHTEQTKKKLSDIAKGKYVGEKNPMYGRKGILAPGFGCIGDKHPMFGKHHSEETKKKYSVDRQGDKHPMFGKHHSEETKKKISLNHADFSNEKHPRAKLIWDQIYEIREKYQLKDENGKRHYFQRQLAEEYEVCISVISHIVTNRTWIESDGRQEDNA